MLFLIRSLHLGGAERQLAALAAGLDKTRFDVMVCPMYAGGELEAELRGIAGVTVTPLNKSGRWDLVRFGRRLLSTVFSFRPHIIHGYMGGANELALLAGLMSRSKIVWGIRVSDLDFTRYRKSIGAVFRIGRMLSRMPDLIITNSHRGRDVHVQSGYASVRMIVIPNGVDTGRFAHTPAAGAAWRARHSLPPGSLIIGYPARLDPMKDHETFLQAAASFRALRPPVGDDLFVCMGDGDADYREGLHRLADGLGLRERVRWLHGEVDPRGFYSGCDIVTSVSAFGEGFQNILVEAMACERVCVATDAGDARMILGDLGIVVAPRDPGALARAWSGLAVLEAVERRTLGARARERVIREYSIARLVERSQRAFDWIVADQRGSRPPEFH
ncbi:MAG: glycosyltransferase [Candidatus Rokubacteria bacterium]|nr:glycosyltransferase [Candidatus Rokubacteria bacterium]